VVPPLDPWASGYPLTMYYYLGHWMLGTLALVSRIPSNVVWNLALPTVTGLAAVMLLALGKLFLPKIKWLPLLLLLIFNPAVIYHYLLGEGFYMILDGSRWVVGVPTEYPLFSLILGDAHGHIVGIFNQILLLFLLGYLVCKWNYLEKMAKIVISFLCVLSLGTMGLISTWDIIAYAPLTILTGLLITYRQKIKELDYKKIFFIFLGIAVLAMILYLPYYIQMYGQTVNRIVPTIMTTNPFDFFLYSGFFLVILYFYIHKAVIKRPLWLIAAVPFFAMGQYSTGIALIPLIYIILMKRSRFTDLLAFSGLSILIFCELFSFIQGNDLVYYRFITIFKLYYIAWIFLCISSLFLVGEWFVPVLKKFSISKGTKFSCIAIAIVLLLAVPWIFHFDVGKGLRDISFDSGYYTLDGLAYMETTHPDDLLAIEFLRKLSGDERIVEATGQDWTYFSRISSYTGIPTILGEPNHELSWRGYLIGNFWDRERDVQSIYEERGQSLSLLKKYNVTLLYVGDTERTKYKLELPDTGLVPIFIKGNVTIYRVNTE